MPTLVDGQIARHVVPALRADRRDDAGRSGRAPACSTARGLAGGELVAGRRHQGHLGAGGLTRLLGRTANNVYWMARYVERAENLARLLASTYHMSLLPVASGKDSRQWEAPLQLAADREDFAGRFGEVSPGNVLAYMALDADNVSSIRSCIRLARENARATRPELTTEVWEGINSTYLEVESMSYPKMVDQGFGEFFDWVKERSHLFRGAIYGTMRRAMPSPFPASARSSSGPTTPRAFSRSSGTC